jgi:hypothetical protein
LKISTFLQINRINIYNNMLTLKQSLFQKKFSFSLQEALDFGNGQSLFGQVGMGV